MNEIIKFNGVYEIIAIDINTGKIVNEYIENTICQGFIDQVWKYLNFNNDAPLADLLNIDYFAIGDGSTAAQRSDATLESETFRKAPATKSYTDNKFTVKLVIASGEGNPPGELITEVGMFSNGTITADSGTLISRATVNIPKNSNIQLIITWTLTI